MTTAMQLITKYYTPDEMHFAPGERSFVAWVSTEQVDREGDVVVASGVDWKSQYLPDDRGKGNPVVMAIHDYGKWPLGQCEWLKLRQLPQWRGLFGKFVVDDTPDTELVWKKIQSRTVRGVSIGFTPPADTKAGEWGPPTKDEIKRNPHWAGAKRIIRRCVMIELSICPIGMNPSALIEAVSKGLHKPQYTEVPAMSDVAPVDEPEVETETKDVETPEPENDEVVVSFRSLVKAYDPDEDGDDDSDGHDEEEEEGPIRKGHHVSVVKGPHRGAVGKVVSVHRSGMVPDVDDDVKCTKAEPGCRVKCYKAMGDGHKETEHHVGCKMAHCERRDEMKPPSKKKGVNYTKAVAVDILPHEIRTDEQVRAEQAAHLKAIVMSPDFLRTAIRESLDMITGAI